MNKQNIEFYIRVIVRKVILSSRAISSKNKKTCAEVHHVRHIKIEVKLS